MVNKNLLKNSLAALLFAFGSLFRFFGLFNNGYYFDMIETQYTWGKTALELGVFGFWKNYPISNHFDYPQISLVYEYFVALASKPFGLTETAFVVVLKLVNWGIDILFVFGLFYLGKKYGKLQKNTNYLLSSIAYILPSIWFVSGVWGQNDTLIVIIAFLCFYLLFQDKENLFKTRNLPTILADKYFLSGIVLGAGVWIKQQPVLILPILALYFLFNKNWRDITKVVYWILPFLGIILCGGLLYSDKPRVLFMSVSNWQIITGLASLLFLAPIVITVLLLNKKGVWYELRKWFLGFWGITAFVSIPALILNPERLGRVTFATVGRTDIVSNGAATFWSMIGLGRIPASSAIISFNGLSISISAVGIIIYIALILSILFNYFQLNIQSIKSLNLNRIITKKFTLIDFSMLMFVHTSGYFLFFTKMHSRYLHFGIIFSLIILFLIKQTRFFWQWFWLAVVLNLSYFLNQAVVYTSGKNNDQPLWIHDFVKIFKFDIGNLSSFLSTLCFALMYVIIWQYFDTQKIKLAK